mmetsp:Transcript_11463/g.24821  ORF Transcript_11463/g.24821 Transcript_11463/m.24821 type:complete len:399 (-) Transcript_11463:359-1555(-)
MDSVETVDEIMIASVDATLASWRSAFESSPKNERTNDSEAVGGGSSLPRPAHYDAKSPPTWKDPDAYQRRLITFTPKTYFAKPLALSPLVCAAFGWENTGKDIIKCRYPSCGATICILFHPSLNEESHERLCQKYFDMLVSSHSSGCPFRPYASRWSKVMQKIGSNGERRNTPKCVENTKRENNSEYLINKVSEALSDRKTDYYVPPYFLSLSDEFSCFEDCTGDGSITSDHIKQSAIQLRDQLLATFDGDSKIDIVVPDAVKNFCHKVLPDADIDDLLHQKDNTMKVPYLLSTFGWTLCEESLRGNTGVIMKCNVCLAKTWLELSSVTDEGTSRKRRRVDPLSDANLKLIESHRAYCPFVSGFCFGSRQQPGLPGWKVVVSNLLKSATHIVEGNSEC